jgi:CheY-like chemotaxis protein
VRIPERATVPALHMSSVGATGIEAVDQASAEVPRLDGLRILVVDDEQDAMSLLTEALREQGAEVHGAASAREALELLSRVRPDVMVSDISMPEMDGLALMRSIRMLGPEEGGAIPAVALTAFARGEDVQRALRAGYHMHLSKPVEMGPLARVVDRLGRGLRSS